MAEKPRTARMSSATRLRSRSYTDSRTNTISAATRSTRSRRSAARRAAVARAGRSGGAPLLELESLADGLGDRDLALRGEPRGDVHVYSLPIVFGKDTRSFAHGPRPIGEGGSASGSGGPRPGRRESPSGRWTRRAGLHRKTEAAQTGCDHAIGRVRLEPALDRGGLR